MDGSVAREALHTRRLAFQGFRRADGLFEIEARLTDDKTSDFTPPSGTRRVAAGDPIHDIHLRVVFDGELVVRGVQAGLQAYPYSPCVQGGESLQALVGERIGRGWSNEVRRRLPAGDTCAHLREILIPLASAVHQTMHPFRVHLVEAVDDAGRPVKIDSCYAYGVGRALVLQRWPTFYRGPVAPGPSA